MQDGSIQWDSSLTLLEEIVSFLVLVNCPDGFQGGKATLGVRGAGHMNFFRLIGGEATGWCFRDLND